MCEYKTCNRCGKTLEVTKNFYKKGKNSTEYRNYCKQCGNNWQLNYYKNNREERVAYQMTYETNKRNAKKKYDIEKEETKEIKETIKKYYEGKKKVRTVTTSSPIRNKKLANDYKEYFKSKHEGKIWCEVCKKYENIPQILEVHHKIEISNYEKEGKEYTTFNDVMLLCPTCHKLLHTLGDLDEIKKYI